MNIPKSEKEVLTDFNVFIQELTEWKRYVSNQPHVGFFVENGHITRLTLQKLNLSKLPNSIGNLKELREINLNFNHLKNLPESFQNLINLEILELGGNDFISLPDWIGNLKNLLLLYLGDDKLQTLPETIGNLKNLKEIDLSGNYLTSLPDTIGNLENLNWIALIDNKISVLPESFRNLKKLQGLYLEDASLRSFSNIPREYLNGFEDFKNCFGWEPFSSKGNYPSKHAIKTLGENENIIEILDYYSLSPLELAAKYVIDQNSLTPVEKDRLSWEGGFRERHLIETGGVAPDDSILAEINHRLTITCDNGLELIK